MVARLTEAFCEETAKRIGELVREGYAPPGSNVAGGEINATTAIARERGIKPGTMQKIVARLRKRGYGIFWGATADSKQIEAGAPETSRAEVHDASFWRKKAAAQEKALGEAEHLISEISGLRGREIATPKWLANPGRGRRGKSVIGCLVSDVHMGEVIDSEEILGINAFDPGICANRMHRYFEAVCTVGQRWASDTDCQGALVALAGDMISGDIHEELRITNALTSHEQVGAAVGVIAAGLRMMLDVYPRIHVVGVPGNHGRTTIKPTAKLYARLSYDTLVCSMLEQQFQGDKRITWQYGRSTDQITPIFGRTVLTTHGDKIGTRGGMGFAGPDLPIVRGSKKIREQQAAVGWNHDLVQFGHYHWSTNPANGRVLGNGSVPGYSEFASDIRAVVEPPQQWLYLLHDKWWLRERAPIQLEEPRTVEKPKVRVPVGWTAA